jgi:hypothetical protein
MYAIGDYWEYREFPSKEAHIVGRAWESDNPIIRSKRPERPPTFDQHHTGRRTWRIDCRQGCTTLVFIHQDGLLHILDKQGGCEHFDISGMEVQGVVDDEALTVDVRRLGHRF